MYTTLGFQSPATFFSRSSRVMGFVNRMMSFGNLTFCKNYASPQTTVNADFALGSKTGTWTVTRSASTPATYIDSNGLVATKTDTTPRFTMGFYDTSGLVTRPGILVEVSSSNLVPKASTISDATWALTNTTASNTDAGSSSPDGTATAPSLTATGANGTLLLTTAVTAQTYSVWLKRKTGTGNIDITANGGTAWTTVTVTSSWTRHQVTAASASQKCGIRIVTSGDEVYVWGNQFEALPFATSLIPTTGSALTRNEELLRYSSTSRNRNANIESIFCSFTTFWTSTEPTVAYRVIDLEDDNGSSVNRLINLDTATDKLQISSNATDSPTALTQLTTSISKHTKYVLCGISYGSTADVNTEIFLNGVSESSNSTNYTIPGLNPNFSVGSSAVLAGRCITGIFHSVAIFNVGISSSNVSAISQFMALT